MSEEIENQEVELEEENNEEQPETPTEEPTEVEETEETPEEDIDWKTRALKAEGLIQKNKKKAKKAPTVTKKSSDSNETERIHLRLDGYPEEMLDDIIALGGREAIKSNPIVKNSVQNMKQQHDAEQAAKIKKGGQGEYETKHSLDDLRGMDIDELEKTLPHADNS